MKNIFFILALIMLLISCNNSHQKVIHTNADSTVVPLDNGLEEKYEEKYIDYSYQKEYDSTHLKAALEQLHLSIDSCNENLIVEAALPYLKNSSILVIPRVKYMDEGDVYDSYILIMNDSTKQITNLFYEKDAWISDAIRLNGIHIDTTTFTLNDTIQALGIALTYCGHSRPNPYGKTSYSLFYPSGDSLIRVLKDFEIEKDRGEWDMHCAGEFEFTQNTLVISSNKTNGLNDIIIKTKFTTTTNFPKGDDCDEKEEVKTSQRVLHFINGKYGIPKKD